MGISKAKRDAGGRGNVTASTHHVAMVILMQVEGLEQESTLKDSLVCVCVCVCVCVYCVCGCVCESAHHINAHCSLVTTDASLPGNEAVGQ